MRLIGVSQSMYGELPSMDAPGRADPYCVLRLSEGSNGKKYPAGGHSSRICYRTTRPKWHETIEMALCGGKCETVDHGTYSSCPAGPASPADLLNSLCGTP